MPLFCYGKPEKENSPLIEEPVIYTGSQKKNDSCYSAIFKDFLRFLQIALGERWGFIKAKGRQNDNWHTCLKMSTTCSKNGGRKSDGINS